RIGARRSALEKLDRDQEGVEPAVRAALALGDAGVLGPLADFIEGDATLIAAAESYLGAMARALVVEDEEAVRRILRWFAEEWKGGGALTLLPLDQVPAPDGARGPLADGIEPKGPAGAWVRELLAGVEIAGDAPAGVPVTVHRGVVRVGNPAGASAIL